MLSRVIRAQVFRFERYLALPSPPDLTSYLDIVIETAFRRLQVKMPEDELHPVSCGDCDHSGCLKVVGIRLGVQRGSHLPKELLWDANGASHPAEQDWHQDV